MVVMAKKKPASDDQSPKQPYPSRLNTKYVGIPASLYDEIKARADSEERSVSWLARKLLRKALDADQQTSPPPQKPGGKQP